MMQQCLRSMIQLLCGFKSSLVVWVPELNVYRYFDRQEVRNCFFSIPAAHENF